MVVDVMTPDGVVEQYVQYDDQDTPTFTPEEFRGRLMRSCFRRFGVGQLAYMGVGKYQFHVSSRVVPGTTTPEEPWPWVSYA